MTIQGLQMSVGRTWRFMVGDRIGVAMATSGYRKRLNDLKGGASSGDFRLPWPPYRSRLWEHMFSKEYTETETSALVAGLLPLRWTHEFDADVPGTNGKAEVEAILHPFAVTTLVHLSADPDSILPADLAGAYEALKTILRARVDPPAPDGTSHPFVVADGPPLELVPALPTASVDGETLTTRTAGTFMLLSTRHDQGGALVASALARQFSSAPVEGDSTQLLTDDSWIAVKDSTIGASFSSGIPAIVRRAACAHHNFALLTAYMENLRSILSGELGTNAEWYRVKSAMMLNSLFRRRPLPPFDSVHQARLSELWIRERNLIEAIDAATFAQPEVPTLKPA